MASTMSPTSVASPASGSAATFWKYSTHLAKPNSTSLRAWSIECAMCMGPTRRHLDRWASWPFSAAISSQIDQCAPNASKPPWLVAPSDSRLRPYFPASRDPDGDTCAATPTSMCGRV